MAYASPPPEITWDRPGILQGVTIRRLIEGKWYAWKIPHNGLVSQAMAADLLGVSTTAVNNWINARKMRDLKIAGQPSAVPLSEVKRIKKLLTPRGRLGA
jgi:hypothetical protein